jgi:hypothetical protein
MPAVARIKAVGRTKTCRIKTCRVAAMLLFVLLLAGCDSCGDWISPMGHACRQQAPRPS